jgi:hypothetical protein
LSNRSWRYITTSRKEWCRPMSGEHFMRFDLNLSLTWEESLTGFYWTTKSWEKARSFRSCGPLTFPWTSYRDDDVLLGSVGSTGLSKSTWRSYLYVPLIMDRDIFRCQKMQSGVWRRPAYRFLWFTWQ